MEIEYISHACVKIKTANAVLLSDPWILNEPIYNYTTWKFPKIKQDPEQILDDVTHIYISHTHEDHFHIPSLACIDRKMTFIVPSFNWHPGPRAAILRKSLEKMGFTTIHEIDAWKTFELSESMRVIMVPAAQSKSWDWENSGLIIQSKDATVFNVNDCPTDDNQLEELNKLVPIIDVALIQYAGVTMHPGRFKMPKEEMQKIAENKKHSFVSQNRLIKYLNIKNIIPFAGDFCWLDKELFHCNWACRSTPKILENWLENSEYNSGIKMHIMYPNDVWRPESGVEQLGKKVTWSDYLSEIKNLQTEQQQAINNVRKLWHESDTKNLKNRTIIYLEKLLENIDGKGDINFKSKQRVEIVSDLETFSFVMEYSHKNFSIIWDEVVTVDQTFRLPDYVWASVLEGYCMFSQMAWLGETEQHVEFRNDLARMWFWNEYYLDLNNRSPQLRIDSTLHPHLEEELRFNLGVFHHPH